MVPQPRLCLQEDFSKQVMVQLAKSVFNDKLSKKSSKMFLESARAHVNLLANIWSSQYGINIDPTTIVKQIPVTREAVFHRLGLEPEMTDQICCKKCFALYPMDSKQNKCTKPFLSSAQLFNRWAEAAKVVPHCDQDLRRTSSEQKQKPIRTFTYMTLKAWLSV
jgi:hypothetical protein